MGFRLQGKELDPGSLCHQRRLLDYNRHYAPIYIMHRVRDEPPRLWTGGQRPPIKCFL